MVKHGLKLVLKSIWSKSTILEAEDLNSATTLISGNDMSLIVFGINMPRTEKLEELIQFIVKETKGVIISG